MTLNYWRSAGFVGMIGLAFWVMLDYDDHVLILVGAISMIGPILWAVVANLFMRLMNKPNTRGYSEYQLKMLAGVAKKYDEPEPLKYTPLYREVKKK